MLMDKMMMNQKKMLVHLLSYKPIVCLVALWRMGSSITISGDHPRKRFNPSLEPDIWRNIQDGKWGELTLAYTSYLSTTVLTGVPKSLASGHWLRRMLPTKASSWKGIMWQTGKKKTQAVEIYEEPWQKVGLPRYRRGSTRFQSRQNCEAGCPYPQSLNWSFHSIQPSYLVMTNIRSYRSHGP